MKLQLPYRLMALVLIGLLIVAVAAAVGGCGRQAPAGGAAPATGAAAAVYTCPMHAEVQSATPGQCPKCHMDLVKKTK